MQVFTRANQLLPRTGTNVVIANEHANWRRSRTKVRRAERILRESNLRFTILPSEGPGHARELAATAAAEKVDTLVVIGGDGTVNEAVNGLIDAAAGPLPRLGVIPIGTSNDLSKSLGLPQDLERACRAVVGDRVRHVDVGRVGDRCFCSASCLGYFADIAAVSHEMKGLRGSLRYVLAALTVVRKMRTGWNMEVTADGQTFRGEYAVLLVGNAPRFGGLTMLPGACADDGVLDCLLIEMAGRFEALQLIPLVYQKAMERHARVTRFRTKRLSVTLNRPSRLCNDGEICPESFRTVEYSVLPGILPVLC